MEPTEVEGWLGASGAITEIVPLEDEWTSVEGWSPGGRRHVAILIHPDIPERFAASVRERRERAEAIILVGQLGVTEIGRWLVDGRCLRELNSRLVEVGP